MNWGWRIRMSLGGAILGVALAGIVFDTRDNWAAAAIGFLVAFLIAGRLQSHSQSTCKEK
jgi:hypothetical protein